MNRPVPPVFLFPISACAYKQAKLEKSHFQTKGISLFIKQAKKMRYDFASQPKRPEQRQMGLGFHKHW